MTPAETIRSSLGQVAKLREAQKSAPALADAVGEVKRFQSKRLANTYADLMVTGHPYGRAARFFLSELYGEANFSERDAQFARIAGAMQRLLPASALTAAVCLAKLHALSEELDYAMGIAWQKLPTKTRRTDPASSYRAAWQLVERRPDRETQLQMVLDIGKDLERQTRTLGLRTMLKMMHGPASAAGLADLQRFLEIGFDTFAELGRLAQGVEGFLAIVKNRETLFIAEMFGR